MGICLAKGSKTKRRIDLKVYPRSQFGYGVLYFTGSAQFNKNMRIEALKYGYSLSDAGIKPMPSAKAKDAGSLDKSVATSLKQLVKK